MRKANVSWREIASIGITNQRETLVAWNRMNGQPLYNAIVWQCRRSVPIVEELKNEGYTDIFHEKTGLVLDAYFSGTKAKWLIDNVDSVRDAMEAGNLRFGTIDSWIIKFLTGSHATDESNASRTLLYNINKHEWDDELLEILKIPKETLPVVMENAEEPFGVYRIDGVDIPIRGVLGDQQAALFGQGAFNEGNIKTTFGTGNFSLLNTGTSAKYSKNGLLTTIGWQVDGKTNYALEGSVFIAGAALKWLRDGLNIIEKYNEIEDITKEVESADGVYFVPAFVGLGAPYWDPSATGTIIGITGGTKKANIIHATLDAIAYQTEELVNLMREETGLKISVMRVDGGSTKSDTLMQKQADISQMTIERPVNIETTALGAGLMAGYKLLWNNFDELANINPTEKSFKSKIPQDTANIMINRWKKAVERSRGWIE